MKSISISVSGDSLQDYLTNNRDSFGKLTFDSTEAQTRSIYDAFCKLYYKYPVPETSETPRTYF